MLDSESVKTANAQSLVESELDFELNSGVSLCLDDFDDNCVKITSSKPTCSENSSEDNNENVCSKQVDKGKKRVETDSSDNSDVKAILFPKIKNVSNQLFVMSGFSKGECSRLNSIVMKDNSDVHDYVSFDKNGFNKNDNWCSQYKYLQGNVTKARKEKSPVRNNQQKRRDRYRKNLRKRRMKWRENEQLSALPVKSNFDVNSNVDVTQFNKCNCACQCASLQ